MENAVEALKIAFGVMMFVLALTLSISCFSQASSAVDAIVKLNDRETEYTYVEPSAGFTRVVGVETIIPTMYQAYRENICIYFKKANDEPLPLYCATDIEGEKKQNEFGEDILIDYIDLELEDYGDPEMAKKHLDTILAAKEEADLYQEQFYYEEGLYEELSKYNFEEILGEYYQDYTDEDESTNKNKIKKRVITYKIIETGS